MQITQRHGGKLLRIAGLDTKASDVRDTRRQAITARLLALPRLLAHAYLLWRFTLKMILSDEVIRSQVTDSHNRQLVGV